MSGDRRRRPSSRFEPFRGACRCTRDRHVWQIEVRLKGTLTNVVASCSDHLAGLVAASAPERRDAVTVRRVQNPAICDAQGDTLRGSVR